VIEGNATKSSIKRKEGGGGLRERKEGIRKKPEIVEDDSTIILHKEKKKLGKPLTILSEEKTGLVNSSVKYEYKFQAYIGCWDMFPSKKGR